MSSKSSSSKSSSNEYSSTDSRYRNKIAEYEVYKYNYQHGWEEDQHNKIKTINKEIQKLRSNYSSYSAIDALRTTSKNIKNKIKHLEKRKLKIESIIKTFPKRIKDLDDCIKYYTNKLNKNKNKSSSTKCIYSRKK